jgi:hypothetical protein
MDGAAKFEDHPMIQTQYTSHSDVGKREDHAEMRAIPGWLDDEEGSRCRSQGMRARLRVVFSPARRVRWPFLRNSENKIVDKLVFYCCMVVGGCVSIRLE